MRNSQKYLVICRGPDSGAHRPGRLELGLGLPALGGASSFNYIIRGGLGFSCIAEALPSPSLIMVLAKKGDVGIRKLKS